MKFKALTPMLETRDMKGTIAFYTTSLGFTLQNIFEEEGETTLCTVAKDELAIMFCRPNKMMNYGRILLSGSLYVEVDDVDAYWQQIKDKAAVLYEPEDYPYGMREFGIKDNNGYVLNFGQPL